MVRADHRRQKKKLIEAARWWATGGAAQAAQFSADCAALNIQLPDGFEQPATHFVVDPENWDTVMLFVSLGTQWRIGGMGDVIGLDYTAVDAVFRIRRIKNRASLFDGLQVMEEAALAAFREAKPK
ncbi:DUF1799 domain-containing protein [Methylomonas koyamae]|nr:DUF1799 domain-containing protein [Methylomonas koyamae]